MRLKHTLAAACLIMVGGAATACGGDDSTSADAGSTPTSAGASADPSSAPTDTSVADFCTGLTSTGKITDGKDVADFATMLETTGTPSDIPAEARSGYEIYVGALEKIDESTTPAQLKKIGDLGLSTADQTKVQSFMSYAGTLCAPSASPSASQ
ncbi:MAG: hypothetical protein JWO76_933 [Nocardioides sp.]|nr:hypothetical protein [Nocardioides sp.]